MAPSGEAPEDAELRLPPAASNASFISHRKVGALPLLMLDLNLERAGVVVAIHQELYTDPKAKTRPHSLHEFLGRRTVEVTTKSPPTFLHHHQGVLSIVGYSRRACVLRAM